MSYQSQERKRLVEYARKTWEVEGHVLPYKVAAETLHQSVRETELAYFNRAQDQVVDEPLGRRPAGAPGRRRWPSDRTPGSSQVACVNHLEPARFDRELARRVARNVGETLVAVRPVEDGGFVGYEWIGKDNYLGEAGVRVRGANITSLDALMCAECDDGTRVLTVIEWGLYCSGWDRLTLAS